MLDMKSTSTRLKTILRYIAANVYRLRVDRGWTQKQLAEESELNDRYVQVLETGKANPTVQVLVAIADALGVAPTDLFLPAKLEPRRAAGRPPAAK